MVLKGLIPCQQFLDDFGWKERNEKCEKLEDLKTHEVN